MRQHIDIKQWKSLSEEQQQRLIPWLLGTGGLKEKHYSRYFTIGQCIELIRQHHQLIIYTVDKVWCVQLFDLNDCANEDKDCIYEFHYDELIDSLFEAIVQILDDLIDS